MSRRLVLPAVAFVIGAAAVWTATSSRPDEKSTLATVGDSYASGEGLAPYESGTDTGTNQCHRSPIAFPQLVAERGGHESASAACSGARIDALRHGFQGEPSQLSRVSGADLVLVMVGGNDVDALSYVFQPETATFTAQLPALEPRLVDAYNAITQEVGTAAEIFAVGYPSPVSSWRPEQNCAFAPEQVEVVRNGTRELNRTVAEAASKAGIGYIDTTDAFAEHGLCDAEPWINGIQLANLDASLHPNAAGHERLAEIVSTQLRDHD